MSNDDNMGFFSIFKTTQEASTQQAQAPTTDVVSKPVPVSLPVNYFRPSGSDSLDLRSLNEVPDGSVNQEFFSFRAPLSTTVRFTHYAVFTDILLAGNVEFIPRVNGSRVLRYHGDPNNGFKINLSLGPDMSDASLIPCEIVLQAGQSITWSFTNTSGADAPMGVRLVGFVDNVSQNSNTSFGG
jgi:hypothetical protein